MKRIVAIAVLIAILSYADFSWATVSKTDILKSGTFTRNSVAFLDGKTYIANAPRKEIGAIVSPSDFEIVTDDVLTAGTSVSIGGMCKAGTKMYATAQGALAVGTGLYSSTDGHIWTQIQSAAALTAVNRLYGISTGAVCMAKGGKFYYSADGTDLANASLPAEEFSFRCGDAYTEYWNFYEAANGKIIAGEYSTNRYISIEREKDSGTFVVGETVTDGTATGTVKVVGSSHYLEILMSNNTYSFGTTQITASGGAKVTPQAGDIVYINHVILHYSTDHGASWTSVTPTFSGATLPYHSHAICKQEATGKWYVVYGDGDIVNVVMEADDSDLTTWTETAASTVEHFQPVALFDYGHPTKLLYGGDSSAGLGTYEPSADKVIQIDGDMNRVVPYVFAIYYWDGVYYAATYDNNNTAVSGLRRASILVSQDLIHWLPYHTFKNNESGIQKFIGYFGGKIHCVVQNSTSVTQHAEFTPVVINESTGICIDPATTNLLTTTANSSAEGGLGNWSSAAGLLVENYTSDGLHGTSCAKYTFHTVTITETWSSGTFLVGDTVTNVAGASGLVKAVTVDNVIVVAMTTAAQFAATEEITATTGSGATVTPSAAGDIVTSPAYAGILYPLSFTPAEGAHHSYQVAIKSGSALSESGSLIYALTGRTSDNITWVADNTQWQTYIFSPIDGNGNGCYPNIRPRGAAKNLDGDCVVLFDCAQNENGPPTRWQVGGTARAAELLTQTITAGNQWTEIINFRPEWSSDQFSLWGAQYIKSWYVSAGNYMVLYWTPSTQKFSLVLTVGASDITTLTTTNAYKFLRNGHIGIAVRYNGNISLSVYSGSAVETVTGAGNAILIGSVAFKTGASDGSGVMSSTILTDDYYSEYISDTNIPAKFIGSYITGSTNRSPNSLGNPQGNSFGNN